MAAHRIYSAAKLLISTAGCALLVTALALAGCSTLQPEPATRDYLDRKTGTTVTASTNTLILAHADLSSSSTQRDYLHIGPVEINRMGKRTYFLWLGAFTTLARGSVTTDKLTLEIDDDVITLQPLLNDDDIKLDKEPYSLPVASNTRYYAALSADLLLRLAAASTLTVVAYDGETARRFYRWDGNPTMLSEFAASVGLVAIENNVESNVESNERPD